MPAYDSSGIFITNTIGSTLLLTRTCKNQTNSKTKQTKKLGRSSCTAKIKQFYQYELGGMLSTILAKLSSKRGTKHSQILEQTILCACNKRFWYLYPHQNNKAKFETKKSMDKNWKKERSEDLGELPHKFDLH